MSVGMVTFTHQQSQELWQIHARMSLTLSLLPAPRAPIKDNLPLLPHPNVQGEGIYGRMLASNMAALKAIGCERVLISTQVNNIAVQRAWGRQGLRMADSYYTLHQWFYRVAKYNLSRGQHDRQINPTMAVYLR